MNIKEEILRRFEIKFGEFPCFDLKNNQLNKEKFEIQSFLSESIDKVIQAKNKEFEEKIKSCPMNDYDIAEFKQSLLQELNK